MGSTTLGHEDLLKLEMKIAEDQNNARTKMSERVQEIFFNLQTSLEKKIDDYFKESKEFHKEQKDFQHDILKRIDRLEDKFAGKWTEKILIFIGGTIGTTLIIAILSLIIIK